jgi:hypothetical protein
MARDFTIHIRSSAFSLVLAIGMGLVTSSGAFAQASDGLTGAIFALRGPDADGQSAFDGRLFGGSIAARIQNGDENGDNFSDADTMQFLSIAPAGGGAGLTFPGGNRAAFENWVQENSGAIMNILFPSSVSAGVLGRDLAQDHSQQLLLNEALEAVQGNGGARSAGGLLEYEWFERDGSLAGESGRAWRGFYQFAGTHLSVEGRYAQQNADVNTRSTTAGVAYRPSIELNPELDWRVGLDARTTLLYSSSRALDLGTIDLGAGAWTSARKDFARVRVGGGAVFQGTKSHVPSFLAGDGYSFLADAINDRGLSYDVSYGTILGFVVAPRTSLNAKVIETRAVAGGGERPASRLLLASVSHLFGGDTPIDVGYKISTGGGINAHSIFLQGNFRF